MNLQTIRYRFSIFLKQFRIEDLKLLMKFLNEIVNEYKNSKASRLFDLLSHQESDENDEFKLIYDDDFSSNNDTDTKKAINTNNSGTKLQNNKPKKTDLKLLMKNQTNQNGSKRMNFKSGQISNQPEINQDIHFDNNLERVSNDNLKAKLTTESNDIESSKSAVKKPKLIDHILSRFQEHDSTLATSYLNNDSDKNREKYKDNSSGYNYDNQENHIDKIYKNEQSSPSSFSPNQNYTSKSNEFKRIRFESSWNNSNEDETLISSIKCAVCNDSASGTRYGVCVCEGCKEFFRRQRENPSNNKILKCVHGTNKCEINVENRTHWKCRLDKCLKLGMKLNGKFTNNSINENNTTDQTI